MDYSGGEQRVAVSGRVGNARPATASAARTAVEERPRPPVREIRIPAPDAADRGGAREGGTGPRGRTNWLGFERKGLTPARILRVYICVLMLVPSTQVFKPLGGAGTPANMVAIGGLIWYVVSWIMGRVEPSPRGRPARLALYILALTVLASFVNAMLRTISAEEVQGAQRGLLMVLAWTGTVTLATRGVTRRAELEKLVNTVVTCGTIMATVGIVQFYVGFDVVKYIHIPGLSAAVDISTIMVRDGFNRPAATTAQPIEFGVIMAMCLPLALYRALNMLEKSRLRRWYPVAVITMVLPLTVSRSGIIGLVVAVLVVWVRWSGQRKISALIVGAFGMGAVGLIAHGLISSLLNLFSTFFSNSDSSTQARTDDYSAAFHYISLHPIFGRGFQTFTPDLYRYMDNTYLLDTIELGIVGVVVLFVMYLLGMHCGAAGRRRTRDPRMKELGQSFVASVAVAMVTAVTFDAMTFAMYTGELFLIIGLSGAYLGITTVERDARLARAVEARRQLLTDAELRADPDLVVGAGSLPDDAEHTGGWARALAPGTAWPETAPGHDPQHPGVDPGGSWAHGSAYDTAGHRAPDAVTEQDTARADGPPAAASRDGYAHSFTGVRDGFDTDSILAAFDDTATWSVGLLGRPGDYTSDDTLPMFIGAYGFGRQRAPLAYGGERHVFEDGVAYGGTGTIEIPRIPPPSKGGDADGDGKGGFGRKVRVGAIFSLVNTLVMRAGNFITTIFIVRMFSHDQWGIYAAGTTALQLLLSMNEAGVSLAIIRWEGDVRKFGPTVVTLSTLSSTIIYVGLYFSAPWVAGALGVAGAAGILRLLCLCVVIDGLAAVPLALLAREFMQGRRLIIDAVNFVISTGITLALAIEGWGANALAWGSVIGNTIALVLAMVLGPYIVWPGISRVYVGRLIRFGLPLAGASLLALGVVQVDNIIVGHTLGADALGLYLLAFSVSSWPVRAVSEAARRVSFAGFSRLADRPDALAEGFYRSSALLTVAVVPLCVLLIVLAEPLINVLYGHNWVGAVTVLRYLAVLGMLRVLFELAYDCLAAMGRSRALMTVQGIWLGLLIPILILGAHKGGINGVGIGHVVVAVVVVIPAFLVALAPGGVRTSKIVATCVRPAIAGVVMAAACYGGLRVCGDGWTGLIVASAVGLVVYLPIVAPMLRMIRNQAAPAEQEPATAAGN